MKASEYHARPDLSSHIAKLLVEKSPLHAWTACQWLNPNYVREEKDEFDLGNIVHSLVLEGSEANLAVIEANDWRTKDAKAQRDEARAAGKTPILARKMPQVRAIVYAAHAAVAASELNGIFAAGEPEKSIFWSENGVACKARLDWWTTDRRIILDLKTTTNAEPNAFIRQITSLGYDFQAEFYRRGAVATSGVNPVFIFLAVEVEPPYACSLVALGPQMLEIASRKVDFALSIWSECLKHNRWNGYSNQIHYAEPTPWDVARWLATEEAHGQT